MSRRSSTARAILLGGLIAGTIDVGSAALIYGASPVVILHNIACGVYGLASFAGGTRTAVAGLILQWIIGLLIASVYSAVSGRLPVFRRRWILGGLLCGVGIFVVMNYVVVPLSAVGFRPHFTPAKFVENLAALWLFGLIVAYFARARRGGESSST